MRYRRASDGATQAQLGAARDEDPGALSEDRDPLFVVTISPRREGDRAGTGGTEALEHRFVAGAGSVELRCCGDDRDPCLGSATDIHEAAQDQRTPAFALCTTDRDQETAGGARLDAHCSSSAVSAIGIPLASYHAPPYIAE